MSKYLDDYREGNASLEEIINKLTDYQKKIELTKNKINEMDKDIDDELMEFLEGQTSLINSLYEKIDNASKMAKRDAFEKQFIEALKEKNSSL